MYIKVNGTELYYEVSGRGRPLILVHGNGESHEIFDEAVQVLSQHFTCYAVDSRGHGHSEAVERYHYQDMAFDMCELMERLSLTDVVFYGFSDGGIIGLLAAMMSKRIGTLIISGANLYPHGMTDETYREIELDYERTGNPKALMMLEEPDISTADLRRVTVPTLVLAGSDDLIKEEHTRQIAAALPNSTLKILPEEGHETYIIHSQRIAEEILCYLEQK